MNTEKFIPYGRQWIDEEDVAAVVKVLRSDWLTQGPAVERFEHALAGYCGAKYAVVFNSGTSALHGAYFSAGLSAGDEFITSPNTFVATANAGLYLGARPVFSDVEAATGNIDSSLIEGKITGKTRLIVPVHYAGHPAEMEPIYELASTRKFCVIEDACHALGALYKGDKVGRCRYSDMTVFSFHPVKHITTGEGGMVLTNREEYFKKLMMFRSHGISKTELVSESPGGWYYEMQNLGYNYRLTDIQAALGVSQMRKLDGFVEARRIIAREYDAAFGQNSFFDIPVENDYAISSYHLYPIRLKEKGIQDKKRLFDSLRANGLGVQVHYMPVYLHPYYKAMGYKKGLCRNAEYFYKAEISLPLYPTMTSDQLDYVIKTVFKIMEG